MIMKDDQEDSQEDPRVLEMSGRLQSMMMNDVRNTTEAMDVCQEEIPTRISGSNCQEENQRRVTWRFMREYRRRKWEKMNYWKEGDLDRKLDSTEARPEQLQNFEKKMILIGSDVVALYPNLDIRRVVENVKEAVKLSRTTWEEIDYLGTWP